MSRVGNFDLSKIIQLSEAAFLSIICGVVEVYKRECLGVLLGYKTDYGYNVVAAPALQLVSRKFTKVTAQNPHWTDFMARVSGLFNTTILGDYHSHPQRGKTKGIPVLSKVDLQDNGLQIIIAANDTQYKRKWKATKKYGLYGAIAGVALNMQAYFITDGVFTQLKLVVENSKEFDNV